MNGKIDIDSLITHKLPLERINEAFDLMHAGKSIRTVVEYCMTAALETLSEHRCFERRAGFLRARVGGDAAVRCASVSSSPSAPPERPAPLLYFLAGLECNEQTFAIKAGAQRVAAALGLALVTLRHQPAHRALSRRRRQLGLRRKPPASTSTPRRSPGRRRYRMDSYVTRELPAVVERHFPVAPDARGIFGHSMGGHGALALALRNPDALPQRVGVRARRRAVAGAMGAEGVRRYLATTARLVATTTRARWCARGRCDGTLLVDQGTADKFLDTQLKPELFEAACADAGQPLELRRRAGYDHGYYFIATFVDDHLRTTRAR